MIVIGNYLLSLNLPVNFWYFECLKAISANLESQKLILLAFAFLT